MEMAVLACSFAIVVLFVYTHGSVADSVVGVCVCSGLFLWYVITPLTTGLARMLQRYQSFV